VALTEQSITLVERGSPVVIPEAEWQTFGLDDLCDTLHAHGVIGMKRVGGFRLLEPRHYVGELQSRGRSLRILPKVEGLLESLRSFVATLPAKLVTAHEDWQPSEAAAHADPARALLSALDEVLIVGIPATYDRAVVTTSHPRGRILFNETVQELLSRGIRHKARCEHSTRHGDYTLGAVLDTVVRTLVVGGSLPPLLRFEIERLVELFETDSQAFSVEEALSRAQDLLEVYDGQPEVVALLEVSIAILRESRNLWDFERPVPDGDCRFSDTDRLWETAVFEAMRRTIGRIGRYSVEFHPLRKGGTHLFVDGGPEIDPDIIVFASGRPVLVVDAKYSLSTGADASDVYQITCYTQRLGAAVGLLAYLSPDARWFSELGHTSDSRYIAALGSGTRSLTEDLLSLSLHALKYLTEKLGEGSA